MGAPGFDDAPVVELHRSKPKPITFVYPFYCNQTFLGKQLALWSSYPEAITKFLRVIVVDDGSPVEFEAESVIRSNPVTFPLRLFKIEVDVRWNWLAARNIGMHHANGWCLLTDMDHMVPDGTADALINEAHSEQRIYRLTRHESDGKPIHPHPNTMFMRQELFWKIGGYDEALSGFYGTDGDWRRRCAAKAKVRTLKYPLERHEYEGDSSTTKYLRKQPEDAGKKAIIAMRDYRWKPKTLSFPFHEVKL